METKIMYRGKTVETNQWVVGGHAILPMLGKIIGAPPKPTQCIICVIDTPKGAQVAPIAVKDDTVCQFINETDKDGKPIFEGDILEFDFNVMPYGSPDRYGKGAIEWRQSAMQYSIRWDNNHVSYLDQLPVFDWNSECKVVGNIYDNPDMIPDADG